MTPQLRLQDSYTFLCLWSRRRSPGKGYDTGFKTLNNNFPRFMYGGAAGKLMDNSGTVAVKRTLVWVLLMTYLYGARAESGLRFSVYTSTSRTILGKLLLQ